MLLSRKESVAGVWRALSACVPNPVDSSTVPQREAAEVFSHYLGRHVVDVCPVFAVDRCRNFTGKTTQEDQLISWIGFGRIAQRLKERWYSRSLCKVEEERLPRKLETSGDIRARSVPGLPQRGFGIVSAVEH